MQNDKVMVTYDQKAQKLVMFYNADYETRVTVDLSDAKDVGSIGVASSVARAWINDKSFDTVKARQMISSRVQDMLGSLG